MDNKSDKFGEEEYRPVDEETTNAFEASTSDAKSAGLLGGKMPNIAEHLNRKNIIIAVGVLIGLFCVYKIADVLFAPGVPRHKTTNNAALVKQQHAVTQAPVQQPVAQTVAPQVPVETVAMDRRLSTLEQQTSAEQANLEKLSGQINDMQTALTSLDTKLSMLTDSVQTMANQVAKQQAAEQAKQAAKKQARYIPRPIYFVRAMVPGRAWLATQDGGTITVSLGNNLPGYGTVEVIDPNQGTLVTSTGAIIGYSPSDS